MVAWYKYHIFTLLFQVYDTLYVRSLLSYFPLTCDCPYGSVVQDSSRNLIAFSDFGPRHLCCKNSCAKVQYLNLVSFCPQAPSLVMCWWENYSTTLGRSLIYYFIWLHLIIKEYSNWDDTKINTVVCILFHIRASSQFPQVYLSWNSTSISPHSLF
jgi:hypothetical protein